ncbi:hypothetical protein BDV24DRAFT_168007 [Aspergillus arachidicola]|uniref:Cyanovirin-N domain-containing protein n=1 Tax=Aspergillus arachidicola TaxID=656916 RepID=A0A5N6XU67_9EURO|nr:hypothetical protein BDV24DRAFT_168007 [Aspergillus arachidicola]
MYRFLPLVFLPLAVLAADEPPKDGIYNRLTGGLYDTCNATVAQHTKGEKAWVTGKCRKRDGGQMESHLDLDRCFTWTTLHMQPEKEGRAFEGDYCSACAPGPDLGMMMCYCATGAPRAQHVVNLNKIIGVDGGPGLL